VARASSSFAGKLAIVTGGASGIGAELCSRLGASGAEVVVADLDLVGAERVATAVTRAGGRARACPVDVTDAAAVQALVDEVPRLDLMFNNAGVMVTGEGHRLELAHWNRDIDINLRGVVHGVHAAYRRMVEQGAGHIINTASLAGLVPAPGWGPYTATKAGVVALSLALRAEGAALGVKVSVVCPGYVKTRLTANGDVVGVQGANARAEFIRAQWPYQPASPETVAKDVLYGVAKNRAVILTPRSAYTIWWLYRLAPGLVARFSERFADKVRSMTSGEAGRVGDASPPARQAGGM
jgi:NAD(P)-dependent dehydrogenase (short-subunit alcohol dehydrogenase family)